MRFTKWLLVLLCWLACYSLLYSESEPKHLTIARSYLGVNEKHDKPLIQKFLKAVGIDYFTSWCAAFAYAVLNEAGVSEPKTRSALARTYVTKKSIRAKDVLRGKVKIPPGSLVIWQKYNTGKGHIGFVDKWSRNEGYTIEGNTSATGKGDQSNGGGVYYKHRYIVNLYSFRITHFTLVTYANQTKLHSDSSLIYSVLIGRLPLWSLPSEK